MSIVIPSTFDHIEVGDLSTGQEIETADWVELIEGCNYLWSIFGSRVPGFTWRPHPWTTTSTSMTVTDENTNESDIPQVDLSVWTGMHRPERLTDSSDVRVRMECHVNFLDVEWTINRIDLDNSQTQIAQNTFGDASANWLHINQNVTLSEADISEGGNSANEIRPLLHTIRAGRPNTDAAKGKLNDVAVWELVISDTDLIP